MQQLHEHRLTDLEIKLTFLEKLVEELNKVVTAQQDRLDRLERLMKDLEEHVVPSVVDSRAETKPPHY